MPSRRDKSTITEQSYEMRLRRMAERQGLALHKSLRRDPRAKDFGEVWLTRLGASSPEDAWVGPFENLDEVEDWLMSDPVSRRWPAPPAPPAEGERPTTKVDDHLAKAKEYLALAAAEIAAEQRSAAERKVNVTKSPAARRAAAAKAKATMGETARQAAARKAAATRKRNRAT